MKKYILSFAVAAMSMIATSVMTSCSDVAYDEALYSTPCTNLKWTNEGRKLTLSWDMPADATGAIIYKDNVKIVELKEATNTYTIKRAEANTDNLYTVKVVYADGRVSEGVTTAVHIKYDVVAKAGFLVLADMTDDDEVAAKTWFETNYVAKGTGKFITPAELATINVDEISRIMIIVDRVGLGAGWDNLPADLVAVIDDLKAYAEDDGKLLLLNHATQLVEGIGRTNGFAPGIFGSGNGGENPDVWGVNAVIGNADGQIYNHTSHAIFAGLESGEFTYGHAIYPTIGTGWKEDHNCMWDLNSYGLTGGPNVVVAFQEQTNSTVLGTWQHVVDYCCAAIVEFNPTTEFTGRIIAVGPAAYEFSQLGANSYQSNVEKLAANALEYLK